MPIAANHSGCVVGEHPLNSFVVLVDGVSQLGINICALLAFVEVVVERSRGDLLVCWMFRVARKTEGQS